MEAAGWLQIAGLGLLIAISTPLLGIYMYRVYFTDYAPGDRFFLPAAADRGNPAVSITDIPQFGERVGVGCFEFTGVSGHLLVEEFGDGDGFVAFSHVNRLKPTISAWATAASDAFSYSRVAAAQDGHERL